VSRIAIGTIIALNHLPHARTLAYSIRKHHPEVPIFVLIATAEPLPSIETEPFITLNLTDLNIPDLDSLLFIYDIKQVLVALKPILLRYLLKHNFKSALLLDTDMLMLDPINDILEKVSEHALTLTPHLSKIEQTPVRTQQEHQLLLTGIYNGGFIGVSNRAETLCFLDWWETRLNRHCIDNIHAGFHYDQRWLDFAPSFIADLYLIHDPGINTAYWNLSVSTEGQFTTDEKPCRLFHFSGFNPDCSNELTMYEPNRHIEPDESLKNLLKKYITMLIANGLEQFKNHPWPWDSFSNKAPITRAHRDWYRKLTDEGCDFGNPFNANGYRRYFHGPRHFLRRIWRVLRRHF